MTKEYTLRLREIRKTKKLTQGDLATMVGVTERIVGSWEREETSMSLFDAVQCAKALGCTPNDLCGWATAAADPTSDPQKRELSETFDSMNRDGRSSLLTVARGLAMMPENRPGGQALGPRGAEARIA